jgi:hypothetical protein
MDISAADKTFAGAIPEVYERYMVPLLFEPYARDLAERVAPLGARRVLGPGGRLVFNVWDRIERNGFADTVQGAVASLYEQDPPSFMARVPHGYFDPELIRADLRQGGFEHPPMLETVDLPTTAASPRIPAVAICQGTPMRHEIETRDPAGVLPSTDAATTAVAARFGCGAVVADSRAFLVSVESG